MRWQGEEGGGGKKINQVLCNRKQHLSGISFLSNGNVLVTSLSESPPEIQQQAN